MTKPILTVGELVTAFGGTGDFAQWLDVVPGAVSNWKSEGSIPRGYHLRIYLEAKSRGLKLSPSIFGLREWPDEENPKKRVENRPAA